jgi:hypothetical protein
MILLMLTHTSCIIGVLEKQEKFGEVLFFHSTTEKFVTNSMEKNERYL